jgi:peptidoglycan hydrolase-like protein with peptidoglycan-binding domain
MLLRSRLFQGNAALEACLLHDQAHVTPGSVGEHVQLIQRALVYLGDRTISGTEYRTGTYGKTTTAAVLAFKQRRQIINHSYQRQADNIVGKMTIRKLDDEVTLYQNHLVLPVSAHVA